MEEQAPEWSNAFVGSLSQRVAKAIDDALKQYVDNRTDDISLFHNSSLLISKVVL